MVGEELGPENLGQEMRSDGRRPRRGGGSRKAQSPRSLMKKEFQGGGTTELDQMLQIGEIRRRLRTDRQI